jgi:hypothetical protein
MSRIWRRIAPAVAAAGLVTAVGAIPAEAASTAAVGVTISATSPHYPGASHGRVDGYALVIFRQSKGRDAATVSGKVTGLTGVDVVSLIDQPFRTKGFTSAGKTVTQRNGGKYSFTVTPSTATRYAVQIRVAGKRVATSAVQIVYVTEAGVLSGKHQSCSHTRCVFSYRVTVQLPASALATEAGKPIYKYQIVGYPKFPSFFSLARNARTSGTRKLSASKYEFTLTFYIPLRNGSATWDTTLCTKDTETRDGMGLPGGHGCGAARISTKAVYIG